MEPFSDKEKQRLLAKIVWDLDVNTGQLLRLLNDEIAEIHGLDRKSLFRRLLTTYDWYTLLKLIPTEGLGPMLDDTVLDRLYPRDLRAKFIYAREVLSG